jgi:hypothetical protein
VLRVERLFAKTRTRTKIVEMVVVRISNSIETAGDRVTAVAVAGVISVEKHLTD